MTSGAAKTGHHPREIRGRATGAEEVADRRAPFAMARIGAGPRISFCLAGYKPRTGTCCWRPGDPFDDVGSGRECWPERAIMTRCGHQPAIATRPRQAGQRRLTRTGRLCSAKLVRATLFMP